MATKTATAIAGGTPLSALDQLVSDLNGQLKHEVPVLLMAFASTTQPLHELMPALAEKYPQSVLLGSSTSGEFTQSGDQKDSVAVFALAGDFRIFAGLGKGLKENVEAAVMEASQGIPQELTGYPYKTAVLLLDPLAGNGEEAVLITASLFGGELRLAGGAAGDDLQMKETFVSLGKEVASNSLVLTLIFSKNPIGVGVCHGHKPLSNPLRVTRAEGNIVYEIDHQPAWQVWVKETKKATEKEGLDPHKLPDNEVGGYLLRYEAGLANGQEYKIRAPLSRNEDGSLNFACGIPEGSVIRITESYWEDQVDSAREAAKRSLTQLQGATAAGAVVFDCVCRKLILSDNFATAIKEIHEVLGSVPLAGFETYGEIALDAGDMSGFHNTTTVVLTFPDDAPNSAK